MSALDKIIKRAKQGSSGSTPSRLLSSNKSKKIHDDDDYKTIVDKPSSTYALTPYKSTKSIPSTFTNDFERIYQVVKSSYNCGVEPNYIYENCYYDSLVQNYVQKGVADVSSMNGFSNVSLQDLPLACNIPSVAYKTCSPPTNMLIEPDTESQVVPTQTTAGFRINFKGRYLQVNSKRDGLILVRANENGFILENTMFLVENKKLKNFITNKFVTYNIITRNLELADSTNWILKDDILNFNFINLEFINQNSSSGIIYDVCLIEKYTNRLQSYATSINSYRFIINQTSDVISDNFNTIILYNKLKPFRYLGYNVETRLIRNQDFTKYTNIDIAFSEQYSKVGCSSNGNWIGVSYTNSISNGNSYFDLLNINLTVIYRYDFGSNINGNESRIVDFKISDDGNIIYILINNPSIRIYEIYKIYAKKITTKIYTINTYWSNPLMNISFSGKNIIIYGEYDPRFYVSLDYGNTFNYHYYNNTEITSARFFNDEIYLSSRLGLTQLINNSFISVITSTSNINGDFILINVTNKYFIFAIRTSAQIDLFITDKNRIYNMYLTNVDTPNDIRSIYVNNTCSRYITVDANTELITNYDLNIPSIYQDTPYILKNGPLYPSYSFSSSIISTQGVKNVFNDDIFVLSSDNTIIKKISNNLSITSSSILKDNIILQIPVIQGSIKDIACSDNGQVIIVAVYNDKLLLSINGGSSFSLYNEADILTGNTSSKNITNITRYWISVACSFSGKYMSACAYNGNIFTSTNKGTLFTSSPINFSKKWVQIVMSKSSDDAKDGIVQLACAEDGLFISYDRGTNWSQIRNKVIDSAISSTLKWSSIAISDSGQYMLATVYGGNVYASYNYGYDWTIYGISRKECYEPALYPNTSSNSYIGYNVSASSNSTAAQSYFNVINAFMDNNLYWSPTDNNSNVIITFPLNYKFLLTEIQIVNLTSVDIRIKVEGSIDGSVWNSIGDNLNLYSTVNTNTSYSSFKITFYSTSNIQIQSIKLLGKTDIVRGGIMSERRNWKSCSIVSETQHYATIDSGLQQGLHKSVLFIGSGFTILKPIFNSVVSTQNLDWNNNLPILSNNYNKLMIFINENFDNQINLKKINIGIAIPASNGGMNFLYDDETITNSSTKLVPQFSSLNYIEFINGNVQNINKFTWCLSYINDNTFTIQNINTGRFLKAFNYYDSTYVYVGDNSSVEFNTILWFLQRE